VSTNIKGILDEAPIELDRDSYRAAIFYSISSTQNGLSGVDLGNFLIKRVVKELQAAYPELHTFCTLSPIPMFRKWLAENLEQELAVDNSESILLPQEINALLKHRNEMKRFKV